MEYHLVIVRALVNTLYCPEVAILLRSTLRLDGPIILQNISWLLAIESIKLITTVLRQIRTQENTFSKMGSRHHY